MFKKLYFYVAITLLSIAVYLSVFNRSDDSQILAQDGLNATAGTPTGAEAESHGENWHGMEASHHPQAVQRIEAKNVSEPFGFKNEQSNAIADEAVESQESIQDSLSNTDENAPAYIQEVPIIPIADHELSVQIPDDDFVDDSMEQLEQLEALESLTFDEQMGLQGLNPEEHAYQMQRQAVESLRVDIPPVMPMEEYSASVEHNHGEYLDADDQTTVQSMDDVIQNTGEDLDADFE